MSSETRLDGLPKPEAYYTALERRMENLKKLLALEPKQAIKHWAERHLYQWHKYRDDGDLDEENTAIANIEIIYWNTLLDILENGGSDERS